MRLFNKTIDRQLFKQYSLGSDLSKQEVVVKIFNPTGNGRWFILNSDPNDPDYLWAIVDLGYGAEVGSVSRSDLETYRGRFGLGFERDLGFDPINAEELYNGLQQGKFYAKGGGVDSSEENTFDKIFLHYGFAKKRGAYGIRPYEHKKLGTYAQIDDKTRSVEIETPDDEYKGGYSVKGVIEFLKSKGFEETGSYADGGEIEVVYERRADFKNKPIRLVLLNKGKEQKGYTFSGKDQVAVLDNYNRNKQEDLEKLWNLKGYETKYADGGSVKVGYNVFNYTDNIYATDEVFKTKALANKFIKEFRSRFSNQGYYRDNRMNKINIQDIDLLAIPSDFNPFKKFADGGNIADFSDNQLMIMNQNVEVEHHHEELEDILKDKTPVPAWVVAKMETATQNLSDITHYLDGEKELMEDENEDENEEDSEEQEGIKNQNVVEPIDVSAGTKTDLTKNFTDEAWGNLRGFLKGMEGVDLRDDYTFDYKDEQYEVEPIINSDENGVSNAVFTIFDGDGEEVGDVSYSRDGGKQKFTANSEFFSWNNAKFEDGGYFDGTIPKVSTYMSNYADGGKISVWEKNGFIDIRRMMPQEWELVEWSHGGSEPSFKGRMYFQEGTGYMGVEKEDGEYWRPKMNNKVFWRKIKEFAKGGEVAKAEILGLSKNIMGTTSIEMKISGMRKSQDFSVYPIAKDDTDKIITIQSETRIGKIDLATGRGLMSQSHSNGAYFVHFQMDKLTPFTINEKDLKDITSHIFRTAGDNVGSRGIFSDNSGASGIYADGGEVYSHKHSKGWGEDITIELLEPTAKGWKVKQTTKKGRKTSTKTAFFSKQEISELFEKQYADGGFMNNVYAKGGKIDNKDLEKLNAYWQSFYKGVMAGKKDEGYITITNKDELNKYITSKLGNVVKNIELIEKGKNYPYNDSYPYYEDIYSVELKNGTTFKIVRSYGRPRWQGNVDYKEQIIVENIKQYAKGGMVVTSIKDIPNFKERLEQGKITYRGLGMGKLFDTFYDLAGTSGTRIKVDGKEYYITDKEFDTFSRGADGKMQIRFDAPARKGYADGGQVRTFDDIFGKTIIFKEEQVGKFTIGISSGFNNNRHVFIYEGEVGRYGARLPKDFTQSPQLSVEFANKFYSNLKRKVEYNQDLRPFELIKDVKFLFADGGFMNDVYADGGGLYKLLEYALLEENGNEEYIDNLPKYPEVLTVAFNKNGGHKIYKVYETTLNNGKFVKYPTYRIGRDMKPYSKLKYVLKALDKKVYDENFDNDNYAKGGDFDYQFYEVSASTKNGYDLYKINGIEEQDVFVDNYKTIKEANQAGEKLGLQKRPMWLRYGKGGKMSNFDKLSAKVAKNYEGKPVQGKYQEEYGKVYSKAEAKEVGDKVAGKVKAMQPAKKEMGGETKKGRGGSEMLKQANVLAKKIRKDGESWNDAKKRAFAQLKK